jgi:hypothetical protein
MRRIDTEDAPLAESLLAGVAFWAVTAAFQGVACTLRIDASTPVLSSVCGLACVAVGGCASKAVPAHLRRVTLRHTNTPTPSTRELLRSALASVLVFKAMGGSFHSLCPSSFSGPGAYACPLASLSATESYAKADERALIKRLGHVFGCHSCGLRRGPFVADHQPPLSLAKRPIPSWTHGLPNWRPKPRYRFFPQCTGCSKLQAAAMRNRSNRLQVHWKEFRRHHLTGGVVSLMDALHADRLSWIFQSLERCAASLR